MPVCTAQYAELGLISIMRFVGIRVILVLRLSFAELKRNEILNLGTGDHKFSYQNQNGEFIMAK